MMQKNFIKENFVLIVGLALPVLLIAGFMLAAIIPQNMGPPPKYEMIFSISKYESAKPPYFADFKVKNGRLLMTVTPRSQNDGNYTRELFVYNGEKGSVRKIDYTVPDGADSKKLVDIQVAEFNGQNVDNNSKSPDGFELEPGRYRSRGLAGELFGGGGSRYVNRVRKDGGGVFTIPSYSSPYSHHSIEFIGWIVPDVQ